MIDDPLLRPRETQAEPEPRERSGSRLSRVATGVWNYLQEPPVEKPEGFDQARHDREYRKALGTVIAIGVGLTALAIGSSELLDDHPVPHDNTTVITLPHLTPIAHTN